MVTHPNRSKKTVTKAAKEIPVLVTTSHRGVFFGYAKEVGGSVIDLRAARNCVQWRGLKGFLDLAVTGPTSSCRIGPAADLQVRDITSVAKCSDDAVKAWESAPWSRG